tara:strand:+ start:339 stop:911 length:573 start_codon:yes stop_codon:yes gene_type:complete
MSAITSLPSGVGGGSLVLISTQTASSSSTIDFTSGIDSTYKEYIFKFIDIHPATDNAFFQVNFRDGGSDYDATKTTTAFEAYNQEDNSGAALGYKGDNDLAQSTGAQRITSNIGNDNDQCGAGTLHLFNPSSTTFVKHFIVRTVHAAGPAYAEDYYAAGYCNVTAAIDAVQFSMSSGNIDSGTIKLYGVS